MKQVSLSLGNRRMVTWIEAVDKLIKGAKVHMKGTKDLWNIDEVYPRMIEKEDNNNKWIFGWE